MTRPDAAATLSRMATATNTTPERISFETSPDRYRHWKLTFDGAVATLSMDVQEDAGLSADYKLKLNSYDLGVDIELADAMQRIRFEHPEVRSVVITSLKERIFCAGANIFMLRGSTHAWKVNFCKFTNETRLAMEDASEHSGLKFIAALNGICAGGGYELALACDEILLVDDGNSAVSLPETPLLGVLPGTGGLTRVVDKRKVRRDLADFFGTIAEGVNGKRAVEWRLVDAVYPTSQFKERVAKRAAELAAQSERPAAGPGITLGPLDLQETDAALTYSAVTVEFDRERRVATLTVSAPDDDQPDTPDAILAAGDQFWPLRAFRELDDALLRLRVNEPLIGTVVLKTRGDAAEGAGGRRGAAGAPGPLAGARDRALHEAHAEAAGPDLAQLLRADRAGQLLRRHAVRAGARGRPLLHARRSGPAEHDRAVGHERRSAADEQRAHAAADALPRRRRSGSTRCLRTKEPFDAAAAMDAGLVSFAPDELDWDDEVRLAVEGRAAFSPDALTGMEANLRFAGPETMETKIFGRLTAWQNWIFIRPNAVGEKGALTAYGTQQRPEFDFNRT